MSWGYDNNKKTHSTTKTTHRTRPTHTQTHTHKNTKRVLLWWPERGTYKYIYILKVAWERHLHIFYGGLSAAPNIYINTAS
jgi:hypothetical protein